MIIGNGMLAKSLKKIDDEKFIYFCSGVSNSKETNELEYEREKSLLTEYYRYEDKCLIYFSSYFVGIDNYLERRYYRHKFEMENLIKENFKHYKIFRLPQVVGISRNSNTLTNFLNNAILNNLQINVYKDVRRNLIDVEDVVIILKYLNENNLKINEIINLIATQSFEIIKLVELFELILNKKAIKNVTKSDEKDFTINISNEIKEVYDSLRITFDEIYLENLIKKYYARSND